MKPFCAAPWTQLHILPNGKVRPCAVFARDLAPFKEIDLHQLTAEWKAVRADLKSNFSPYCDKCFREEKINGTSQRTYLKEFMNEIGYDAETTEDAAFDFINIDISFSNQCNLACRFCCAKYSTGWIHESHFLEDRGFDLSNHSDMLDRHQNTVSAEEVLKIIAASKNLKKITLKGGEPFLLRQTYQLLRALKDQGRDRDLELEFASNMTYLKAEARDLLAGFKVVDINVSAEAVGSAYEYIRGGKNTLEGTVENCLRHLDGLPNLKWTFHSLISAYNIFEPIKFYRWMQSLKLQSRQKWQFGFLSHPAYLRAEIMPEELRHQALKANAGLPEVFLQTLKKHFFPDQGAAEEVPELFDQLKQFTKLSDEFNKRDIKQDIPELKTVFS